MKTYCSSFYGSVLWDLCHPAIDTFCVTWRKCLRRVWGLPQCTHSNLLPVMSNYLPLLDELCCRTASFIVNCLESESPTVSSVAQFAVYCGRMNSHMGRNAYLCSTRYGVKDIHMVTRHLVSGHFDTNISASLKISVLSLLELIFIREGVYSCTGFTLSEIDSLIDFICTS